jgi:two-component system sensor histidine kinase RegB
MFDPSSSRADETLRLNLRRLVAVRMFAITVEGVALAAALYGLEMELALLPLLLTIAAQLLLNLFSWQRLRQTWVVGSVEFLVQLCIDVVLLLSLLYFAGGATNPFVSLLLLPLVVAAAVLPRRYVWIVAALVVSGYGVLMLNYQPMSGHMDHMDHGNADFDWHVTGMWFGFMLGVAVVLFFVLRMAESLRERDRILAEARERALRDEQLVALGTLAAGAAHELGTPLSTMAVLSKDLEQEYAADAALARRLTLLRQQVDRCKQTLSMISASAGQLRAESGGRIALDQFLDTLVADWRHRYSRATLDYHNDGVQPAPLIISEQGLRQALVSFLDNAADSSPNDVEMRCHWSARQLTIEIADRGPGLSQELRAQVGKVPFTTKAEGHGLGLLLAHAIIQRLGGEVRMEPRAGGGTSVHVELNLEKLLVRACPANGVSVLGNE